MTEDDATSPEPRPSSPHPLLPRPSLLLPGVGVASSDLRYSSSSSFDRSSPRLSPLHNPNPNPNQFLTPRMSPLLRPIPSAQPMPSPRSANPPFTLAPTLTAPASLCRSSPNEDPWVESGTNISGRVRVRVRVRIESVTNISGTQSQTYEGPHTSHIRIRYALVTHIAANCSGDTSGDSGALTLDPDTSLTLTEADYSLVLNELR